MTQARFDGKVAWITGAASGFGAGAARRLSSLGAQVVLSDIDDDNGERVAAEVGGSFVRCDVSRFEDNSAAVAATLERHGRLDIAFLNAGIATGIGFGDAFDVDRYRRAMAVNLDGVVYGMQAAITAMRDRGGDIVATASLAGLTAVPFDPFYGANKHGVVGLVRAAGEALRAQGIRINAICPGFADTNILGPDARQLLGSVGVPILPVDTVIDALVAAITSEDCGQCWYIQPGRPIEPFRFRSLPGPRDSNGELPSQGVGDVARTLSQPE